MIRNIFDPAVANEIISRIESLTPASKAVWGSMHVAQMLAHCNVTYEMVYENKHPKPNVLLRFILKKFIKPKVVGDEAYPQSSRTAPAFVIKTDKDFADEKARLLGYINTTVAHGTSFFEGKESLSFGKLTSAEWNAMFYKHLDHHLRQFGA
jgi:hypothetical protein